MDLVVHKMIDLWLVVERDLKTIDSLPEDKIRPEFLEGMSQLKKLVFDKLEPKTVMTKRIDGTGR